MVGVGSSECCLDLDTRKWEEMAMAFQRDLPSMAPWGHGWKPLFLGEKREGREVGQ